MYRRIRIAALLLVSSLSLAAGASAQSDRTSLTANAEATLQKDAKGLYLLTRSQSFQLAQYAVGSATHTVVVQGEVAHRLAVTDDLGAKGDETGTVSLAIFPIKSDGTYGQQQALRKIPGDEIKLDSPSGVTVIMYGCCQESSAEFELSLASLKTLWVRSGGVPFTTYTRLGKPALGRLIAVYLVMTAADDDVLGKDMSAVAMITLEGEDEVIERIRVHLRADKPREKAMEWSYELGWKTPSGKPDNHTVIDPAKPSKPVFQWKIGDTETIEIPLVDDRLDIANAKLPDGVKLELLGK
ncbi:MAG TPA: hypothetical protein VEF03_02830 [Candidatus Binataceae bacterium]|nr:hypothetical protein [Candidatus Binataceae bacterium]